MRFISFNLFIRTLTIVSLVVGLIGGVSLIPRPAHANVQPSCSNDPLFTNGNFITGENNGAGNANTSSPPEGYQGLGFLADPTRIQLSVPTGSPTRARLADDFTVTGNGWRPSAITFYAYQTDAATTTSTITGVVDLRLWDGPPDVVTSTVIAGPVAGPITPTATGWTGVYRTYLQPNSFGETEGLSSTRRPIMAVTISWPFTVTTLLTGTYWIEWGMTGSLPSGPWAPAVSFGPDNNARQLNMSDSDPGTWTWAPRVDYTVITATVELPFVICGETIPTPQITSLSPNQATAGGGDVTLTVNGSGFIDGTGSDRSIVYWNGEALTTVFSSTTALTATVPAARIATAGTANVTVVNPGNLTSNPATFTINNPAPTITAISPSSATAGGSGFTLTITGTGFISGSVVRWNGDPLDTFFSSSGVLTATVPASRIVTAGTANVTVFNSGPGGGTSGTATFTINNPTPTITAISPSSATAGGSGFTLTITGTGFISGSVVRWNGDPLDTFFGSSSVLTATVPASRIATAGTVPVRVFNSGPGGGTSGATTFTINNPTPTITAISPSSATAGGSGFTLTITGTGFVSGSVVRWNGDPLDTFFGSSSVLTATVPASRIATAGAANVTVVNPAPGGGTSDPVTFTIQANNPAPTISSVSPDLIPVGDSDVVLTITGSNFVTNSVVRWNGTPLTTTFVSATELRATLPAAQRSAAGDGSVTVFNPTPGGGESSAVTARVRFQVMLPLVIR